MTAQTLLIVLPPLLAVAWAWTIKRQIQKNADDIDNRQPRPLTGEHTESFQPPFINTPKHLGQ